MKIKIKKRLYELYKERDNLENRNKIWLNSKNGFSKCECKIINASLIKELEKLLKNGETEI